VTQAQTEVIVEDGVGLDVFRKFQIETAHFFQGRDHSFGAARSSSVINFAIVGCGDPLLRP
jgi:hypothetical protein